MTVAAQPRRASEVASASPDARMLDLLAAGKSIDHIARSRSCTRKRVEKSLRAELKAISVQPSQDYAKIQIRRLEGFIDALAEKANEGDLAAVDRILKVFDRLDRYHGLSARTAPAPEREEISLAQLSARFERAARNSAPAKMEA
jgi:hypothetical protein